MNKRLGQTVVLLAAAAAVTAQANELSYDYVELHYVDAEIDVDGGGDVDGDGFAIDGSLALTDNVHVFAGFQSLDFDFDVDLSAFEIGGGWNQSIATGTDFVARLSYIDGEIDTPIGDADDSGLGLAAGLRHFFTPEFEGGAFIRHVDLDESGGETSFLVEGEYYLTERFTTGLSLEFGDDATSWALGVRYYFDGLRR